MRNSSMKNPSDKLVAIIGVLFVVFVLLLFMMGSDGCDIGAQTRTYTAAWDSNPQASLVLPSRPLAGTSRRICPVSCTPACIL